MMTQSTTAAGLPQRRPRPVIIDCDPGIDDAVALLMALSRTDAFDVLGICTVAGNAPLASTEKNARKICELAHRRDIKVFAGCPRPMAREPITATHVHGESGMSGYELEEPTMPLQRQHAVAYLLDCLSDEKEEEAKPTLVIIGPMTNLAVALVQRPRIAENIAQIVAMGGGIGGGNVTPAAEYNVYADPHAAHVVLSSGIATTLIGLNVTQQLVVTLERLQELKSLKTLVGDFVAGLFGPRANQEDEGDEMYMGLPTLRCVHDACTIAYLLTPELFTIMPAKIEVELGNAGTLGFTSVTILKRGGGGAALSSTKIATAMDEKGVFRMIVRCLQGLVDHSQAR